MNSSYPSQEDRIFMNRALETTIRIGLVVLLTGWCLLILAPFITPILWGLIISVAIYPVYDWLLGKLGGRKGLSASLISLLMIIVLIIPTILLSETIIASAQGVADRLEHGSLTVPEPPESVAGWPMIGEQVYGFWELASTNLESAMERIEPQLKQLGGWLLAKGAGAGLGILQFVVSVIIAGVFLANSEGGSRVVTAIACRLAGERGDRFSDLASATVRSVAQGVLGVAIIQALLSAVGFLAFGVPAAGVWVILVLLIAIVQLPTLIILAPIMAWAFSVESTTSAAIFSVYLLLVGASDNILKPLLLGRGVEVPMLVILLGAIGGMIMSGIIGLFAGAVVLAVGYKLFVAWILGEDETMEDQTMPSNGSTTT